MLFRCGCVVTVETQPTIVDFRIFAPLVWRWELCQKHEGVNTERNPFAPSAQATMTLKSVMAQ